MDADPKAVSDDIDALTAVRITALARTHEVEASLAVAKAMASEEQALIAHQRLRIAKLER